MKGLWKSVRKRSRRSAALLLALTLSLGLVLIPKAEALEANPLIRVGLLYGSDALEGVNLQNSAGTGFRFGYLTNGEFTEVGRTGETKITMVKNRNVYLNSKNEYLDSEVTSQLVGSFHESDGLQDSREAAETRAAELRGEGRMAFVYYEKGKWGVRLDSYANSNSGKYVTGSKYCISVVITGTTDIIFQFDTEGLEQNLVVAPDITGHSRPTTWFKTYRYTGYFEYSRRDQNNITVVSIVDMQEYVKGVIPYEMSASWPREALKAQAVAARSYGRSCFGKHKNAGFDICNTDHCQVYRGTGSANANSDAAVDETYGVYITYGGKVCEAFFSSSNGGASENAENVWGSHVPYLIGKLDPYEDGNRIPSYYFSYTVTNEELTKFIKSKGNDIGDVVNFYVSKFTEVGNVREIRFTGSTGKEVIVSGSNARTYLRSSDFGKSTGSIRYTISTGENQIFAKDENGIVKEVPGNTVWVAGADGVLTEVPKSGIYIQSASGVTAAPKGSGQEGTYYVSGAGNGHSVGMSQYGAKHMAELGFTYREILEFYYTGIDFIGG